MSRLRRNARNYFKNGHNENTCSFTKRFYYNGLQLLIGSLAVASSVVKTDVSGMATGVGNSQRGEQDPDRSLPTACLGAIRRRPEQARYLCSGLTYRAQRARAPWSRRGGLSDPPSHRRASPRHAKHLAQRLLRARDRSGSGSTLRLKFPYGKTLARPEQVAFCRGPRIRSGCHRCWRRSK